MTSVASAGYKTLRGFNEPNTSDQSNTSVATVLDLWPALSGTRTTSS